MTMKASKESAPGVQQTSRRKTIAATAHRSGTTSSERSVAAFIAHLDMSTVDRIDVICISGKVTLTELCAALENAGRAPPEIRILMRSESSSDYSRIDQETRTLERIERVRATVPEFKYEVRHYFGALPLSGIMCTHRGGKVSSRLSFYDWSAKSAINIRERAVHWCYMHRRQASGEGLLGIYQSWFEHLWGKHVLHTILFDFDDTIFYTTEAQVQSWSEAMQRVIIEKGVELSQFQDPRLFDDLHYANSDTMREIFLRGQEERRIYNLIFKPESLRPSQRATIRAARLALRKAKTAELATPIVEITQHLEQLKHEYQLVIVSSTSEKYIVDVLNRHKMNYFSYIFGREITHKWTDIESKTPAFVRASSMTGIPLSRMCFVGDSDADYRAARQLGLSFIENRINARRYLRKTLIHSRDEGEDEIVVDQTTGRGLLGAIERVSKELASA